MFCFGILLFLFIFDNYVQIFLYINFFYIVNNIIYLNKNMQNIYYVLGIREIGFYKIELVFDLFINFKIIQVNKKCEKDLFLIIEFKLLNLVIWLYIRFIVDIRKYCFLFVLFEGFYRQVVVGWMLVRQVEFQ